MRRIITLFVGLTWVGMGPAPATAQDADLAARITALEATIAAQAQQIAALLQNGQIQSALQNGQKFFRVHVFPFHMTEVNLKRHRKSKWIGEWRNLKEGYNWFEKTKRPPNVTVSGKIYTFSAAR